ncbi:MAG: hypothetical protein ACKOCH_09120, partial [Bacteroidota bacterium]
MTKNLDLNIEGYYKRFTQLIALNRNKLDAEDPDFTTELGDAKGIDISVKWELKRAYFWGAYSLGFVTRDDGKQIYPPVFDRRHNLNMVATYQLGPKQEWEFGARWNLGSGFPFTQTQGFYNKERHIVVKALCLGERETGTEIPASPEFPLLFGSQL